MRSFVLVLSIFISLISISHSAEAQTGTKLQGKASYYADKYHGRTTASGETFDKNAMTAAHRKWPFGTRVKVTNPKTQKSVIVTINDRGPFIKGRIIDLSEGAAIAIGMKNAGVALVELEILRAR